MAGSVCRTSGTSPWSVDNPTSPNENTAAATTSSDAFFVDEYSVTHNTVLL